MDNDLLGLLRQHRFMPVDADIAASSYYFALGRDPKQIQSGIESSLSHSEKEILSLVRILIEMEKSHPGNVQMLVTHENQLKKRLRHYLNPQESDPVYPILIERDPATGEYVQERHPKNYSEQSSEETSN